MTHTRHRVHPNRTLQRSTDLAVAVAIVEAAAITADSERHRAHLLDFCRVHDDALHRSCSDGHLTGSAAVVEEGTGRLALLLHAKIGRWLQPGGHADGEANLAQVSLDEAAEETGVDRLRVVTPPVDIDVHVFDAPTDPKHFHFDVRHLVIAPEGAELLANHESHDLRWFEPGDLADLDLDDGTHRLFDRALAVARELGLVR